MTAREPEFVPMPGAVHPALTHLNIDQLFSLAIKNNGHVAVHFTDTRVISKYRDTPALDSKVRNNTEIFYIKRASAEAPYTGYERQMYTWYLLVDKYGRYIASKNVYRISEFGLDYTIDDSFYEAKIKGWY